MLITNGRTFYGSGIIEKDLLTENGKIKKIGNGNADFEDDEEKFDAKGMLVLPGIIDTHVHMREPGETYKEDFLTGSRAAIAGGITTVFDMPNNNPPTVTAERLKEKQELSQKALCDVFFHFGATSDNFEEVKKVNPISLKMYLSETTGSLLLKNDKAIAKHFKEFEGKIVVHAEGRKLIEKIALLNKNNKMHLAHATTKEEIEAAKKTGATVEVTPHHLFLSKKDGEKLGKLSQVKPPLRNESDRTSLWKSLDSIDCIATDHAPHTLEDKENGAYGFPGLETSLSLMLDAYNRKLISLGDIVKKMAANPAKIFNLNDRGEIAIGKKADLAIVDLKEEWKVNGEEFQTKCKWSPFEGRILKGKIKAVIRNGKLIYNEGEFLI